jgi:hypothetical protein
MAKKTKKYADGGLTTSQQNALKRLTLTGPQAHDPSFYDGSLKMPEWMYGIGQQGKMDGGGSEALNPGMALNLNTGKQTELKKGGAVKAKSKASSASKRADGIATKGKTKGRII